VTLTTGPMLALAPGTRTAPGTGANTGPRTGRSRHPYRKSCTCPACVLHFQLTDERVFAAQHWAGYDAWLDHVWPAAACTGPIRLRGDIRHIDATTGELLRTIPTIGMPDGVIYKPCGNRRTTVCPGCAETYRRDAYQLICAGLIGGKGITPAVTTHAAVFVTFTAPSFGLVHSRPVRQHTCPDKAHCTCRPQPCHARRDPGRCPHGRHDTCFTRHRPGDPQLGQPLCPDCYDHAAHVVWNNSASELWRRTKQAIERRLGQLARRRGVPPIRVPTRDGKYRLVDPVRVAHGKAAEYPGGTHPERLIHACWTLGEHPGYASLRRWAHMLGFGGHFLTKARRYSLRLADLRQARIRYRRHQDTGPDHGPIRTADHTDQETILIIGTFTYAGTGWKTSGDALLANTAADQARKRRQAGRDQLADEYSRASTGRQAA